MPVKRDEMFEIILRVKLLLLMWCWSYCAAYPIHRRLAVDSCVNTHTQCSFIFLNQTMRDNMKILCVRVDGWNRKNKIHLYVGEMLMLLLCWCCCFHSFFGECVPKKGTNSATYEYNNLKMLLNLNTKHALFSTIH